MTKNDLRQLRRDELIALVLAQFEEITKQQVENEVLRMKLEKGKKPPTNGRVTGQNWWQWVL